MGDCTKSTKRIAGNVVEMEQVGEAEEASTETILPKKTKVASQEAVKEFKSPSLDVTDDHRLLDASPHKPSPFNDSENFSGNDVVKSADLRATSFETESSTCNNDINNKLRFSSKEAITSPSSEICGDSEDQTSMDSPSNKSPEESHPGKPSSEEDNNKTSLAAEIDEFFTAADKLEQKRFAEQYNYDIVKDAPLEGRYQWVRLNEALK